MLIPIIISKEIELKNTIIVPNNHSVVEILEHFKNEINSDDKLYEFIYNNMSLEIEDKHGKQIFMKTIYNDRIFYLGSKIVYSSIRSKTIFNFCICLDPKKSILWETLIALHYRLCGVTLRF